MVHESPSEGEVKIFQAAWRQSGAGKIGDQVGVEERVHGESAGMGLICGEIGNPNAVKNLGIYKNNPSEDS